MSMNLIEFDNKDVDTTNFYNVRIISTPDRVEIYKYDKPIKTGHTNNYEGRTKGIKGNAKTRKTSLNIARNRIVRVVEANKSIWRSFITLTYKENVEDIEVSKEDIRKFFRRIRKDYSNFKFLYVIEKQERGALHYHLLTNLRITESHEFTNDFNSRYWGLGFVYLQDVNNVSNIARYISYYLTKDLIETYGKHVYSYSRGLKKPIDVKVYQNCKNDIEILQEFEGFNLQYCNEYQIVYRSKADGEFKESDVKYYDLVKEN